MSVWIFTYFSLYKKCLTSWEAIDIPRNVKKKTIDINSSKGWHKKFFSIWKFTNFSLYKKCLTSWEAKDTPSNVKKTRDQQFERVAVQNPTVWARIFTFISPPLCLTSDSRYSWKKYKVPECLGKLQTSKEAKNQDMKRVLLRTRVATVFWARGLKATGEC